MRDPKPEPPGTWSARVRCLITAALLAASVEARAVSPLVVDDAGTVDARQLQLNAGWRLLRVPPVDLNAAVVNPVFGVSARGEVGATAGYEWRSGSRLAGGEAADGVSDVLVSTKWRFFEAKDGLQLSARLDVKLPASSARKRLGSGDTDLGGVLIATRCWGAVCLDWNAGYVAANVSAGRGRRRHVVLRAGRAHGPRGGLESARRSVRSRPGRSGRTAFGCPLQRRTPVRGARELPRVGRVGSASGRESANLTGYVGATWISLTGPGAGATARELGVVARDRPRLEVRGSTLISTFRQRSRFSLFDE